MPGVGVLFLQRDREELLGLQYISRYLKDAGLSTDILIDSLELNPIKKIKRINPKVIGIYLVSKNIHWLKGILREIRANTGANIIAGGPHPTICPEMLEEFPLDAICIGDGEVPLLEYVKRVSQGKDYTRIRGIWEKIGGRIFKNPPAAPIDLGLLGLPDKPLYKRYNKKMYYYHILTGGGCPFNCSYCINSQFQRLFGKAHIRKRPVSDVINELQQVIPLYKPKTIVFLDDTFTYDRAWLLELLKEYSQRFRHPFYCLARAENLDEELIVLLRAAGCRTVQLGIESPFPEIRRGILGRGISQRSLLQAIGG